MKSILLVSANGFPRKKISQTFKNDFSVIWLKEFKTLLKELTFLK